MAVLWSWMLVIYICEKYKEEASWVFSTLWKCLYPGGFMTSPAIQEQSGFKNTFRWLRQVYFFFRMTRASTTFKPLPSSYTRTGLASVSATSSRRS